MTSTDEPCGTCDKLRDGCDFCCGTDTGDGSCEELNPGGTFPARRAQLAGGQQ